MGIFSFVTSSHPPKPTKSTPIQGGRNPSLPNGNLTSEVEMKGKWRANSDIRNGKSNSAFDDGKATKEKWYNLLSRSHYKSFSNPPSDNPPKPPAKPTPFTSKASPPPRGPSRRSRDNTGYSVPSHGTLLNSVEDGVEGRYGRAAVGDYNFADDTHVFSERKLARRLRHLERANDAGLIDDEDYRLLRKAALQKHISTTHTTNRTPLLTPEILPLIRVAPSTAPSTHTLPLDGGSSLHPRTRSCKRLSSSLYNSPTSPVLSSKSHQPPPSSFDIRRTNTDHGITSNGLSSTGNGSTVTRQPLQSSSGSVMSRLTRKSSSGASSIGSRLSGIGRWHSHTADPLEQARASNVEHDLPMQAPPVLLVTSETTAPAIRTEMELVHQHRSVMHNVFEDVVADICGELGVTERDAKILMEHQVEDPYPPQPPLLGTRQSMTRSRSDSKLLVAHGDAVAGSSGLAIASSQNHHNHPRPTLQPSNEKLHPSQLIHSPVGNSKKTSRSRSSSVVGSTTTYERPLPPPPRAEVSHLMPRSKTPTHTLYSVDRISAPYSIAATSTILGGDPSHKLTTTDLRRIQELLKTLRQVRERQDVITKRFGDRIAWLKEKERGAELKEHVRR